MRKWGSGFRRWLQSRWYKKKPVTHWEELHTEKQSSQTQKIERPPITANIGYLEKKRLY
ncbi:putative cytochrome P450 [Sesbania bispinosa]|nr:putative cytochrome P450 [Sesbania bispinosa]